MNIREATTADIEEIQRVRNSVKENQLSDPGLVTDTAVEDYITRRGKGWVCEINHKLIGFAIVSVIDKNVWALFIQPGFDGQGVGKKLHMVMMDWYFSKSSDLIWLSTSPETRAAAFYRKAGWKEAGFLENGELKFVMIKEDWSEIISEL